MTVIGDYTLIVAGTWAAPAECDFNTLLRSVWIDLGAGNLGFYFKKRLISGYTYPLGIETNYSLDDFGIVDQSIRIWKPSGVANGIDNPDFEYTKANNKDSVSANYWYPYNYELNDSGDDGSGGRRISISCDETGDWVFGYYEAAP